MSTSNSKHNSLIVADIIDEQLGMLPSINLGPRIRISFADRVFRNVAKRVEGESEYRPGHKSNRSSKRGSTEFYNTSEPCKNDEFNSRKLSGVYKSSEPTNSDRSSLNQPSTSNPESLGNVVRINERIAPPIKLSKMSRWELHTVKELRKFETELCSLHTKIMTDNGRKYRQLFREYKDLHGKLMSNHGYMIKELDLCSNWELKAFSGAFGWCLKTNVALKKLKSRKQKYFTTIVVYMTKGGKAMRRKIQTINPKIGSKQ